MAANKRYPPMEERWAPAATGGAQWARYTDDYSEHYEVTNTSRDRAGIGDGHFFRLGDKDSANELVVFLNAQAAALRTANERAESERAAHEETERALHNSREQYKAEAQALAERVRALEAALTLIVHGDYGESGMRQIAQAALTPTPAAADAEGEAT